MPDQNQSFDHYAFMKRLDRLRFNFEDGACNTFFDASGAELILLCFDKDRPRECQFYDDKKSKRKSPERNTIQLDNTIYEGKLND